MQRSIFLISKEGLHLKSSLSILCDGNAHTAFFFE